MKRTLFLLLCLLFSIVCHAQALLWEVSGKGIHSPSYLYGTIHIQDSRVFAFDSTVWNAFNSCEAFAGELLLDEVSPADVQSYMYMKEGCYLSTLLSKEDYAILDSLCKATLGYSALFVNNIKPFFLSMLLEQTGIPKEESEALDLFLLQQARKEQKSCYGLEDYLDQLKALDALSMKEQISFFSKLLHDTVEQIDSEFDTLLQAYRAFDLEKLEVLTKDTSLPAKFNKILVEDRNVVMYKGFVKIAKKERLFCAVGAAHLGGDKGLIALLKKKGYTVKPIPFQWTK